MQPDWVPRYRDAGVDQLIVLAFGGDRESLLRNLDAWTPLVENAEKAAR